MTLIYSNGNQLADFTWVQSPSTGYRFTKKSIDSGVQILNQIQDILQAEQTNESLPIAELADIRTLLSCFAKLAEDMVWQLRVLDPQGPYLQTQQSKLAQELLFFYTLLKNINQDIHQHINNQTTECLQPWSNPKAELKINLGSGPYTIPGWLNIDMFPSDLPHNVLWDFPIKDNTASFVYSSYLLEHLDYPNDALKFLQQIRRVLHPGGVLRICVPNIKPFLQAYLDNDTQFFETVEAKWGFSFGDTLLQKVLNYAGVGHKPGVVDDHKFGYDDVTLKRLLATAGFTHIYPCQYMASRHPQLKVDLEPLLAESHKGTSLSLIFEAVK